MSGIKEFFEKEWVAWTVFGICAIAALVMWRSRAPKPSADDIINEVIQQVEDTTGKSADSASGKYSSDVNEIKQSLSLTTTGVVGIILKLIKWPLSLVSKIVRWIASLGVIGTIVVIIIIVNVVKKKR